ncbi:Phosphomethylpyrimidine kinase [Phaffia rhodozyma]|uniref:Phosphomethylpyrimidine kinase n=1 Tax=Phaffia rhodozyma TaxID=264483 RepID=A0A0F7SIK5_PHARH|nr:Phosphomethylpyrimidine kinase [Phaffia rhodozyma]
MDCPILSIAGSDPSGGAGIQADLKTFTALSTYGMTVLTALTSQNTQGVRGVHSVPAEFVVDQLNAVMSDIPPKAIKTGMLADASIIRSLSEALKSTASPRVPLVIDPVTISTSGHTLLPTDAISALVNSLIPLGTLLTPNVPEASMLLAAADPSRSQKEIDSLEGMFQAAEDLVKLGCANVLLKGGHLSLSLAAVTELLDEEGAKKTLEEKTKCEIQVIWPQEMSIKILDALAPGKEEQDKKVVIDVLYEPAETRNQSTGRFTAIVSPLVETKDTHGTGCTLSAALAVFLGKGETVQSSTILAVQYVKRAIIAATLHQVGSGSGPLDHLHCITYKPLPAPTALNPYPFTTHLISSIKPLWNQYVNHPFVVQLGKGTLDRRRFENYIKQDYHYLRHYARAHALLSFKTTDFKDIKAFSEIALHVARESEMHVKFCETFSVDLPQLLATPETPATSAYALYILDVGQRGSVMDLLLAVASCCLGYGEVGLMLREKIDKAEDGFFEEGNPYQQWIKDYSGQEYQDAVTSSIKTLETRIAEINPTASRLAELTKIWERCTRLEIGFWDGAMDLQVDDL